MKIEKMVRAELLDSNTYIFETQNGVILIEAGIEPAVLKKQLNGRKVLAVLLTHAHYDHCFHVDQYIKEFACPVFLHKNGVAQMYGKVNNYSEGHWLVKSPESAFTFLEGNGQIDIWGTEVKFYSTPGHSHSCMCFLLGGALFAGDLLFRSGVGRTDLETSNKKALLQSLKLVETLKFDVLYSGHGEESNFERQSQNISVFIKFLSRYHPVTFENYQLIIKN